MNQINANAPTPDEIMELVRKNEKLERRLNRMTKQMVSWRKAAIGWREDCKKLENGLHEFLFNNASNLNDKHLNELSRLLSNKI